MNTRVSMIAAISRTDRGLGKSGDLLWKIPDDLKRFRALTKGHPVVMGRKTWESLPERARPLPDRANIIVTRQSGYSAPGAAVVSNIGEALARAKAAPGAEEIFIIGGGEIYTAALPFADRLYLTLIDAEKSADAFFPPYETEFTKELARETHTSPDGIRYEWLDLERR